MEFTIDQALQQGVAAQKEGKLRDAEGFYRSVLQAQPSHPEANHNLGVLAVSVGKLAEAVPLLKLALEGNPREEQFWLSYTDALIKLERFDEARRVGAEGEKSGVSSKKFEFLHLKHLQGQFQAGRFEEAEALAVSLTRQFSSHPFAWKVLGAVLKQTGRLNESLLPMQKSVELAPRDAEAHSNLGATLKELGRIHEAEASLRRAIMLKPDYAEAHTNLGNTLKELGRIDEAEASHRRAIMLKPDYAEAHYNLGALKERSNSDEAIASYKQAIAMRPDFARAYLSLCGILERTNAIDELLLVLEEARSSTNSMKGDFCYYQTLAFFRKEQFVEADALITGLKEDDISEARKAPYFKLKGDLRHRLQDYDAAFMCYENSNLTVKTYAEYQRLEIAADRYFDARHNMARELEQLSVESSYPNRVSLDGRQPTFLVGFPRSGTTLLDTILRTHSKINVVEEQAMVSKMRVALGDLESVRAIEAIDENALDIASDAYLKELARHTNWPDESLVIDKLPLNLLQAPLINRIFPGAKFILAVRHPLDCILSCWMQTFKLNRAMANMVDLDRIVDFYCVAMDIFQLSQRRYGLNTHRVRYEDLVENFEGEAARILSFLDLEWEAELLRYEATALARGKINTPSYSQVIKPIYKTASYRWKHYEKHLEKFKAPLAKWLEEFGYGE